MGRILGQLGDCGADFYIAARALQGLIREAFCMGAGWGRYRDYQL